MYNFYDVTILLIRFVVSLLSPFTVWLFFIYICIVSTTFAKRVRVLIYASRITAKKRLAKGLRRKTTVKPEAEKLLAVKVDEIGNPADVSRSVDEEEPCESLRGVTVVGDRAEDAEEVRCDAPCAKGLLSQYNVLSTLLSYFKWYFVFIFDFQNNYA